MWDIKYVLSMFKLKYVKWDLSMFKLWSMFKLCVDSDLIFIVLKGWNV